MKRAILAVLVGAAVLFFWQFLSWGVLSWHAQERRLFADEAAVFKISAESAPAQGPSAYALVSKAGVLPMRRGMGLSFLGNFLAAFFAVWLIAQLGPRSFVERVGALLTAAWLAWAWAKWPDFVWRGFPGRMLPVELADYTVSWLLAGAAIAWTLRPRMSE